MNITPCQKGSNPGGDERSGGMESVWKKKKRKLLRGRRFSGGQAFGAAAPMTGKDKKSGCSLLYCSVGGWAVRGGKNRGRQAGREGAREAGQPCRRCHQPLRVWIRPVEHVGESA